MVGMPCKFRVDLRNERAEMQLLGELTGVEIAHRAPPRISAGSIFASAIAFWPASVITSRRVLPSF